MRGRGEGWQRNSRRGRRGRGSEAGRNEGWEGRELLVWSRGRRRRQWKMRSWGKTKREGERERHEAEVREKHERQAAALHLPPGSP